MVPPHKSCYRSDLFDSAILTSVEAVECAVEEFEAIVNETNINRILHEVIAQERPEVVRLVVSSLSEELIMSCFPTTPDGFTDSMAWKILSQLSKFFLFAQSIPTLHGNHHMLVKEAPDILAAVASKVFTDGAEPDSAPPTGGKKGKPASQKKTKMARRMAAQSKNTLDSTPFEHLNIPVPETPDEVRQCVELVLATQRSILEAYLESLQIPAVAASVKAAILPAETTWCLESQDQSKAEEAGVGPTLESNESPQESYVAVQPVKFATLYRKRATGFGEWEVNMAPRALRDLHEYNRRDRKTFSLIVCKMRDLSNGDFSPESYMQINGGNVEVPIYSAKITEELRLVYQIDCVPIYENKCKSEQQMLKIFGVYEDAQLTRGTFWDSMSRELGKKGQEYQDRCSLRQRVAGTEGHTFEPVRFPAQEEAGFSPGGVLNLPSDDAEQIQSLLLKTVHFSEELLNNILSDRDVAVILQVSPDELEVIEHPHSCYVLGRSGTGKSTTIIYKMLMVEVSSELSPPTARKIRQLFVCKSAILADRVGEHFAQLIRGYRPVAVSENVKAAKRAHRALVNEEDYLENDWPSDLPKKYSDLQDTDFPLFISFEQLCSMIENDMLATGINVVQKPTLTYDKFRREYWPHFHQSLRKGFESSMVFSEFMGVIMGSEEALTAKSRYLERETYLNLSERGQSTFADQRGRIYDLFERYLNTKRRQGDTDAADRTHSILKFFQDHGVPGRKVDYLYVDETQDNLLVDTLFLRLLCVNPNGLFWAGDTAQTISVGSSFRFAELKAFLFRIESQRQKKHALSFYPAIPPQVFQLTVNYRSHAAIVNCARSVIEVITKFWPNSIDRLWPERGTVDGLRPIFFTNWESESVQSKQFLFGDTPSGGPIELGAHQCILVRDDAARKILQELVGEIGLIMTLDQSKGLEFNDVLLYNFFADSGVTETAWRVVLNAIDNGPPAPALDTVRHASVCTELKFLYVAITRARNNIWIADCSTKGEPMRMLWTSKNQVENCVLGKDTPRFAISSTPEEWAERGRKLFDHRQFSQARLSYTRAYMPHEAAIAEAYHLREEARDMKSTGECFENAEDVVQAITAYRLARSFGRVAELYRQLGKFDEAVATVQNHGQDIDPGIVRRVINVARSFYFNKGQLEKASKLFIKQEEALAYLEDRGMNGERATCQTDGIPLLLSLLEKVARIDIAAVSQSKRDEILMFQAIADQDGPRLRQLSQSFLMINNQPAALLCLDHYFYELPNMPGLPIEAVAGNLQNFFQYVKLLHTVALNVDPCSSSATKKLFGYRKEGENSYSIPTGTFIHGALSDASSDESCLLTSSDLRTVFQRSLRDRMVEKIRKENELCRITKAFGGPCPTFALFSGHCNRANCPQEHILLPAFDSRHYNLRVRILLQQILIYQGLNDIDTDQRRFWLSRLYDVLNPVSYLLGSAASLDLSLIPEAQPGSTNR
ncbi:UvrD-like helicase ATP-binding domain-containing protein [Mycena sanguinolenta]|uniref:UvrD-like helicase ATP-binding domain-containing protein n=1 Tax=Mycena sanguinolenta TaxID=230812 RepID=A0A8H6Z075_9AGAR|nr:UvrD-like helicase ATP-binding domain-containing protein [Mycena sanguinolenta]